MRNPFIVVAVTVAPILGVAARAAAADFTVTSSGMAAFVINAQSNPGLTLVRGRTYTFDVNAIGHPFWIKTAQETGTDSTFDAGVTNNGISTGTLTFTVPASAPSPLYYQCQYHEPMTGVLTILSATVRAPATTGVTRVLLLVGLALVGFAVLRSGRRARGAAQKTMAAMRSHDQ
jgi:hypothetical protein